ncbi:hypothetical protein TorRG33x02_042800 [Trema orientale]|uniref:Uncharacterized protein n=1 Tax=Trema orientale TaxID=63057 RepID=A0A2P5FPX3_TREOI|nr:hypothetical protein TorRG33x02_042800 [Trema orientale]
MNHRVFECKLCPKAIRLRAHLPGRHTMLPPKPLWSSGQKIASYELLALWLAQKESSTAIAATFGGCQKNGALSCMLWQFMSFSVRSQCTAFQHDPKSGRATR